MLEIGFGWRGSPPVGAQGGPLGRRHRRRRHERRAGEADRPDRRARPSPRRRAGLGHPERCADPDDAGRDRDRERLRHPHQAADHLAAPAHLRRDDVRRRSLGPGALGDPLDDARRLSGRGRGRGDQPLHRARAGRAHGAAPPAGHSRAGGSSPGGVALRIRARRRRGRAARDHGQRPDRGSRGRRPARLRLRLHAVAEAAHPPEHRPWRRGRGDAPLVGWAAATGDLSLQALWPFAIVFFWTPPHFWALSC